jgi:glycogen synthase
MTAGRRVLMLVTNDVSRDARVRKEALSLVDAGYDVHVVGVGVGAEASASPYRVDLVRPARETSALPKPIRVAANIIEARRLGGRLLDVGLRTPVDIVHANDLDTLPVAVALKRRMGASLVYDAHELSSEATGLHPLISKVRESRERRLVHLADAVVTVNPFLAGILASRYRLPPPAVVYNGAASCEHTARPAHHPVRLLFQGQFFADRNLEELIMAMPLLRHRALLTLQGWGGVERQLRQLVDEIGLRDTVVFAPPVPPSDLVAEAAAHDVGVISYLPVSMNLKYSTPNKLFDYMAGGLAIVSSDIPAVREVLDDAACGAYIDRTAPNGLADCLARLVDDPDRILRLKQAAVDACPRYSWSKQSEALLDVYDHVSSPSTQGGAG